MIVTSIRSTASDHPRIRGEHSYRRTLRGRRRGSSPHTRGARITKVVSWVAQRIIPAYAGSTPFLEGFLLPAKDHPRIRGEHVRKGAAYSEALGSSPHTRGAHDGSGGGVFACGIIPAYAGSTGYSIPAAATPSDHPRIRGEHVDGQESSFQGDGSSPHTRGALSNERNPNANPGIIPAYAGSTSKSA